MRSLTESQWERYFTVLDDLVPLSTPEREVALQSLRHQGQDNPDVLSLIALHFALPPEPDRCRRGERIDRFILGDQIGSGGMGVVYGATQDIGREVALKLIHPRFLEMDQDEACARYAAEVAMLAKLEHAGIARIYDGGIYYNASTGESCPFFAMQLVRGGIPLTRYATAYGLALRERLELFLQVCEAVQYAHSQGVIHRDLKPANILVDTKGQPVVIDFGLAQACDLVTRPDKRTHLSGTPAYMSPEQVSDAFGCVGPASDVYALGVMLYELIAERRPYETPCSASTTAIRQTIVEVLSNPLGLENTAGGGALETIVEKALEKRPADRYPSVAALQVALRRYLQATHLPPAHETGAIGPFYLADHRLVVTVIQGLAGRAVLTMETYHPELAAATVRFTIGEEIGTLSLHPNPRLTNIWSATHELKQTFMQVMHCRPDVVVELAKPEWRQVTALLVTWTGLAPQECVSCASPVSLPSMDHYQQVISGVKAYDGHVLPSVIGDEVFAVFGMPQAQENHTQRAMLAALDLCHAHEGLAVGIATGRVYIDPCHGDVHAAELSREVRRIHTQTVPGEVLVGASAYRAARQAFTFCPYPEMADDVPATYRLVAPIAAHDPYKIVGRADEIATLQACLDRLEKGTGSFIALVGEAGIGKSRLVAEVRKRVGNRARWLESHALSYTSTLSYGPFRELIRHFANIGPGDDGQEAEAKFVARLSREISESLDDILPYLLKLAGVCVSNAHTERIKYLTPEALGRQLLRAAYRLFACLSSEQPLVLLLENWHRRDHASTEFLTHLLPLIHQSPLCICIVSRSEEPQTERWQQLAADRYYHIPLSALSLDESARLFDTLVHAHEIPSQVQVDILHKAWGNPFFLEEMIFAYTQPSSTASEGVRSIPDTIESQILARVDQLPERLKEILRVAAVVGHSFTFAILQNLLQVRSETLEHDLAELQRLHFIEPYGPAEQAYRFKHDLLQEIIYQHIVWEHRQSLHRQVGDCMEAACTDQLEMIIPQLAYHYAQAEAWDKAKTYLLKTGDLARQVASDTEALRLYRQVLSLLDDKLEHAQWMRLQREIGEAVYWRGKHEEAEALLQKALTCAGSLPPTSCWRMGGALAKHFIRHLGCQLLPRSWRLKRSNCDLSIVTERLRLYELLVWIAYATGRPLRFLLCTLMALNLAERYGYLAEAARCFAGIGAIWDFRNALWLAGYYHRRAVVLAERVQHPRTLGLSYFCLAFHEELLGDWEKALEHHRQAAHLYWEIGDLRDWGTATICLSRIHAQLGNLALSLEESEKLIRVGQQGGDALVQGWGELRKGDNLMRLGVLDDAIAHLQQACILLDSVPEYHTLAEARGLLAQCYWKQGNVAQALAVVQDREQLTSQRGLKSHHKRFAELYLALAEHATGAEQDEAFRKAKAACQAAQKSKAPHLGGRPRAYRLRATYAWLQGKPATARKWWRQSLRSADRLGARWELGMTHLEMGRRLQQASHLQQAEVIFSDIGATWDATQARELLASIIFPSIPAVLTTRNN